MEGGDCQTGSAASEQDSRDDGVLSPTTPHSPNSAGPALSNYQIIRIKVGFLNFIITSIYQVFSVWTDISIPY